MWHNMRDRMEIKELDNSLGTKDYHINKELMWQTQAHSSSQDLEVHHNSLMHRTLTSLQDLHNSLMHRTLTKLRIKDNHLITILKLRISI